MKKHLPLLLSGVLALGTVQQTSAQLLGLGMMAAGALANRKAAKNTTTPPASAADGTTAPAERAPAQPASVHMTEMDLTSYGMPLLLQVPAGTTVEKGKLGELKLTATDFGLEIDEADYSSAVKTVADRKESSLVDGGTFTVGVDEPLVFRARSASPETTDDEFIVAVENPGEGKYYTINVLPKSMFTGYGAAAVETMFTSARSARLTPAAKAVKAYVPVAAKLAVRNAAGEADLSAFDMPVLIKVPAGTKVSSERRGNVLLSGPGFGVRVTTENGDAAKLREKNAEIKQTLQKMGYTLVTSEPMALSAKPKKAGMDNLWMVTLPNPATNKIYMFDSDAPMGGGKQYGAVQTQAMFTAAKTAKLKK